MDLAQIGRQIKAFFHRSSVLQSMSDEEVGQLWARKYQKKEGVAPNPNQYLGGNQAKPEVSGASSNEVGLSALTEEAGVFEGDEILGGLPSFSDPLQDKLKDAALSEALNKTKSPDISSFVTPPMQNGGLTVPGSTPQLPTFKGGLNIEL